MIDVVVSGAAGRMGRAVSRAVWAQEDMRVAGALGHGGRPYVGQDLGEVIGIGPRGIPIEADLPAVLAPGRTWVEFSTPDATVAHAERVAEAGIPMIVGTTGLSAVQKRQLEEWAERFPCLLAPNTSVGAAVFIMIAQHIARHLGADFDIEIIEAHHHFKKDAPSGTAQLLATRLARVRDQELADVARYGRQGLCGPRPRQEIGLHSIRAGDIVGEHTVLFGGTGERLEFTHRVQSIETFAYGAVRAIRFMQDRSPGLYTMEDVLAVGDT